jgi:hypothetical protein
MCISFKQDDIFKFNFLPFITLIFLKAFEVINLLEIIGICRYMWDERCLKLARLILKLFLKITTIKDYNSEKKWNFLKSELKCCKICLTPLPHKLFYILTKTIFDKFWQVLFYRTTRWQVGEYFVSWTWTRFIRCEVHLDNISWVSEKVEMETFSLLSRLSRFCSNDISDQPKICFLHILFFVFDFAKRPT